MKNIFKFEDFAAEIKEATVYNAAKQREESWTKIEWLEVPSYINADHLRSLFANRRAAIRYFNIMSGR